MIQIRPTIGAKFRRDAWLEIDLGALERNLQALYRDIQKPLIPVLKADAYGHGAAVLAQTLDAYPYVHSYAVASADEALSLLEHSSKPIMILGISPQWAYSTLIEAGIEMTVVDLAEAISMNDIAGELGLAARIHLKLDTGMHRIGFNIQSQNIQTQVQAIQLWQEQVSQIQQLKNLEIRSIYSHFASPQDREFSSKQLNCFMEATQGLTYPRHIASSGIAKTFEESRLDMVRCGIELYGQGEGLESLLSLYARISFIKNIQQGDSVSYHAPAWISPRDSRIATLPLGYADGVFRALSNRLKVYLHDQELPQVGIITMDQMMIDLGPNSEAKVGDLVEILGPHRPLSDWLRELGTISYELLTHLNLRLPKIYSRSEMRVERALQAQSSKAEVNAAAHDSAANLPQKHKRGLVATMGALHRGHLSLVQQAKSECEEVCVSIFVNPLQFGPREDFSQYPRDLESDTQLLNSIGVDRIYSPDISEIYPEMSADISKIPKVLANPSLANMLCGLNRPGHFDGVCTVVKRLFDIIQPQRAYFGEKDYQQLMIIQDMVVRLGLDIEIISCPIVREADGLAMSSRNRYLSTEERKLAPALYAELKLLALDPSPQAFSSSKLRLESLGFKLDYLEQQFSRIFVAARLGKTRLIDNVAIA